MEILLFKTSIQKMDLIRVTLLLNDVSAIEKWTVDIDDCDRVLRIVGECLSLNHIVHKLRGEGFDCNHMPVADYNYETLFGWS